MKTLCSTPWPNEKPSSGPTKYSTMKLGHSCVTDTTRYLFTRILRDFSKSKPIRKLLTEGLSLQPVVTQISSHRGCLFSPNSPQELCIFSCTGVKFSDCCPRWRNHHTIGSWREMLPSFQSLLTKGSHRQIAEQSLEESWKFGLRWKRRGSDKVAEKLCFPFWSKRWLYAEFGWFTDKFQKTTDFNERCVWSRY